MTLPKILFPFLIIAFIWTSPVYSNDPSEREIERLIQDEKSELKSLKKKIKKQASEISTMGKKESKILKTLETLDNKKKVRERELKIYRWNIKINKNQLSKLTQKIKITERQLGRQKIMLGKRLRALHKEGKMFPIKVFFSAGNYSDLVQKIKYMELLMSHDSRIFDNYQKRWKQFKEEARKLSGAKEKLIQFETAALLKKSEIEKEKGNKSKFLKTIKSKKIYFIQTRKEMLKASENLNSLIAKLEQKKIAGEGLSFTDKKGHLYFPVNGKILNRFGRVRDKRFQSYIINNGLNLKIKKGTEVHPIFQGTVLFVGSLEGYGNLIILGHGGKYHSLYGHLDKILVQTGDYVYENRAIGLSGDSGSLVGETLYLELRHAGKPIDPVPWLQATKRKRK
jgi:septal ring factor EnvC (AmiA/AmiB activator)